ncbi:MAG: stage II sporulation protein M [Nitriliruptorales bacterium]|nr:stage II sporulation protein M [Nitriliruptorales bacterium]
MDVDRFIATHQPTWERLDTLSRRASKRISGLSPAELDELVSLYQQVSTHLSIARTTYREPAMIASLTGLTARAGAVVYGTRPRTLRALGAFLTQTFPAALWDARVFIAISTAVFLVPAVLLAVWIAGSTAALEASAPEALREAYINEDFEAYYSADPSAQFAAEVTTNNIQVGALAFAAGIAYCVLTVAILILNGGGLGFAAGLFAAADQLPRFFGLILPHGLLELTAVFIAGGAGLKLGWTLIDPGDRPRGEALTEEGRRSVVIVLGLVVVFLIAGLIEGFVTGSPLPTLMRVGIGVVAEAVFLAYALVLGRAAARRGLTGAIGEQDPASWALPASLAHASYANVRTTDDIRTYRRLSGGRQRIGVASERLPPPR